MNLFTLAWWIAAIGFSLGCAFSLSRLFGATYPHFERTRTPYDQRAVTSFTDFVSFVLVYGVSYAAQFAVLYLAWRALRHA